MSAFTIAPPEPDRVATPARSAPPLRDVASIAGRALRAVPREVTDMPWIGTTMTFVNEQSGLTSYFPVTDRPSTDNGPSFSYKVPV